MDYKYPPHIDNSKLIFLLKSFAKKDIKEFKKLISSPIYSNGRNYVSLLNLLLRKKRKNSQDESDEPEKKSVQTFRNRSSELFKLAEEYLVYKSLKVNKIEKNKILLQSYLDNHLFRHFSSMYEKTKKLISTMPDDEVKFQNISALNQMNLSHIKQSQEFKNLYEPYFNFTTISSCTFLLSLFEFGIEYIQQEQSNIKHEFNVVQYILKDTKFNDIINNFLKSSNNLHRLVAMQYYFYKAFESPEIEKNYFEARKIFDEIGKHLSQDFLIRQYKTMTNYCIMRRNHGVKKFEIELFKLYNERLKYKIYADHDVNFFPITTFRNYVLLGLMLKKFKWTEDFIKKYSPELPDENREDEVRLSYSRLFFSNKEYKRSLEYLKNLKGHNYLHYCDSSILKLCCYYELEKYEEAFSDIDKFRHFLRNHKEIQKIHKVYFTNFLKVYQMLLKSITNPERKDKYALLNQMKESNLISRRLWLEEKIEQLTVRS